MPSTTATIAVATAVGAIAGAAKPVIDMIVARVARSKSDPLVGSIVLSAKPRIALIDDDAKDLEQARLSLNGDFDVSTYRKPFRALADIALECDRGEAFDLIVIDYMMEPIDGTEIIHAIRRWQRHLERRSKLVVFTRMGKVIDKPPGVSAVFRKPEDHLRLKEKVREVLLAHQ